jgi:hypothetical protein
MQSHAIRVKLRYRQIYTINRWEVRGLTQRPPILLNALVYLCADIAHVPHSINRRECDRVGSLSHQRLATPLPVIKVKLCRGGLFRAIQKGSPHHFKRDHTTWKGATTQTGRGLARLRRCCTLPAASSMISI